MAQATSGDTIKVHYTGKLEDGTVFDNSLNREPLEFTLGNNSIIPGFEDAIIGMNIGERKTVSIRPELAYGPYIKEMIVEVDRKRLPPGMEPAIGQQLQVSQDGQLIVVTVIHITETHVTLDANHPLAGKTLIFEIELVAITPANS